MGVRDPGRPGAPALARHHRLAGRLGHAGDAGGLPLPGRGRPAHRPRRRLPVVGPPPRAGADPGVPRPAGRASGAAGGSGSRLPPDHRQDHGRRDPGELHRRAASSPTATAAAGTPTTTACPTWTPTCSTAAVTELDRWASRSTCTRSGTAPSATPWTPCRPRATANGANDLRHHIAHIQVVHPRRRPAVRRARRGGQLPGLLGAVANRRWTSSRCPFLGPDRGQPQYPFQAIRPAGARPGMGSDWSVTTADPLEQIEVAVNRIDPADPRRPGVPARTAPVPGRCGGRVHRRLGLRQPRRATPA